MWRGVVFALLATPSLCMAVVPAAIVIGLEALASVVLQMVVLVIVVYGNLWAIFHIRRSIGGRSGGYRGRRS